MSPHPRSCWLGTKRFGSFKEGNQADKGSGGGEQGMHKENTARPETN